MSGTGSVISTVTKFDLAGELQVISYAFQGMFQGVSEVSGF